MAERERSMSPETTQSKGRLSGGVIATLSGLAVLVIVILQNRQSVTFEFLMFDFTWPLWLYTIVVAVFGAILWLGLGVLRRRRRRQARRD